MLLILSLGSLIHHQNCYEIHFRRQTEAEFIIGQKSGNFSKK